MSRATSTLATALTNQALQAPSASGSGKRNKQTDKSTYGTEIVATRQPLSIHLEQKQVWQKGQQDPRSIPPTQPTATVAVWWDSRRGGKLLEAFWQARAGSRNSGRQMIEGFQGKHGHLCHRKNKLNAANTINRTTTRRLLGLLVDLRRAVREYTRFKDWPFLVLFC